MPAKARGKGATPWLRRLFAAIGEAVQGFFASIKGCRHEVLGSWQHRRCVVCDGRVTYTRADDKQVTVPFFLPQLGKRPDGITPLLNTCRGP